MKTTKYIISFITIMSFLTSSFAHAETRRSVERDQRPVVEQVSINEVQAIFLRMLIMGTILEL